MVPFDVLSGPLTPGEIATDVGLLLVGAASMAYFGRVVWFSHPPRWVATYRGGPHVVLAQPFLGLFTFTLGGVILRNVLPHWGKKVLAFAVFASLLLGLTALLVRVPVFVLPGWYRRARRAGVDVRDPEAVEAFRHLSRRRQGELALSTGSGHDAPRT